MLSKQILIIFKLICNLKIESRDTRRHSFLNTDQSNLFRFKNKSTNQFKTILKNSLSMKQSQSNESPKENMKDIDDLEDTKEKFDKSLNKFNYTIRNADAEIGNFTYAAAVRSSKNTISIKPSREQLSEDPNLCVEVWYNRTIKQIGWDKLQVKTHGNCNVDAEFQIAGLLEGKFSQRMVKAMLEGMKRMMEMPQDVATKVNKRIGQHQEFIKHELNSLSTKEGFDKIYWSQINLAMVQLEGILDGYNMTAPENQQMTMLELLFINADGEIMELANAMNNTRFFRFKSVKDRGSRFQRKFLDGMRFKETDRVPVNMKELLKTDPDLYFYIKDTESHCTAVLKMLRDQSGNINDLQIGHSTWDDYNEMIRVYKNQEFNVKGQNVKVNFSSQGGTIYSTDDWQVLGNGMVVTETTMEVINTDLQSRMKPADSSLPNFLRIQVANLLSTQPQDWIDIFKRHTSDTYSSQWILVNMNKVHSSKGTPNLEFNSVIVFEQIVDKSGAYDVSSLINKYSQQAGQNRPYFLGDQAGFTDAESNQSSVDKLHLYSNQSNPRALQIRFLQKWIFNLTDFQHLMRYNNATKRLMRGERRFTNQYQIAPRYDLLPYLTRNFGATDSKVTNLENALKMSTQAISGPSMDNSPPQVNQTNTDLLPKTWNFNWIVMDDQNLKREQSEAV